VKRNDLSHPVRQRLKRLPPPFAAHCGVVPLPSLENGVTVAAVVPRVSDATASLAGIGALAAKLKDLYPISRMGGEALSARPS
jgi:hypothetical protein